MEKYNELTRITKDHLNGELCRLVMEYEDKCDLHICMQYKDGFDNWYDYELILDKKHKSIEFIKHDAISNIEVAHLKRETGFEVALVEYLYKN